MTTSRTSVASEAVPVGEALETPILAISTAAQILIFALCWAGIGLGIAAFLRRRSHEFGPNAALGIILGPFFIFLAFDMIRRRESSEPISLSPPRQLAGSAILVVAVGDTKGAETALDMIEDIEEVGPVTAAVPVEYEVALRVHDMGANPPTSEILDQLAQVLARFEPGLMLMPGRIEQAIPKAVTIAGSDVLVLVGSDCEAAAPGLENEVKPSVFRFAS